MGRSASNGTKEKSVADRQRSRNSTKRKHCWTNHRGQARPYSGVTHSGWRGRREGRGKGERREGESAG